MNIDDAVTFLMLVSADAIMNLHYISRISRSINVAQARELRTLRGFCEQFCSDDDAIKERHADRIDVYDRYKRLRTTSGGNEEDYIKYNPRSVYLLANLWFTEMAQFLMPLIMGCFALLVCGGGGECVSSVTYDV